VVLVEALARSPALCVHLHVSCAVYSCEAWSRVSHVALSGVHVHSHTPVCIAAVYERQVVRESLHIHDASTGIHTEEALRFLISTATLKTARQTYKVCTSLTECEGVSLVRAPRAAALMHIQPNTSRASGELLASMFQYDHALAIPPAPASAPAAPSTSRFRVLIESTQKNSPVPTYRSARGPMYRPESRHNPIV
jgi:hypothetical protein